MDGGMFIGGSAAAPVFDERSVGGRPLTILLAEDETEIKDLITEILQEAGFAVIAVTDGEAAVQAFAKRGDEVDFLLFDLIMPEKNGWEAFRDISQVRPGIPHLFMSGFMGNVFRQGGMDDSLEATVIGKPFTPANLLAKMESILRLHLNIDVRFLPG